MIIYLIIFGLSSFLFACSEQLSRKWEKKICMFLAIMFPAVLAGCRASTIGTDVLVYAKWDFLNAANASSFNEFFTARKVAFFAEPLYRLTVFTLSRLFQNYHWALFTYSLVTLSFTCAGMQRFKRLMNTPLWLGMLLYYLAMYNTTLNVMRQSMAAAIIFFATSFLMEEKYKQFISLVIFGIGFHTSAVIGFLFVPFYYILRQKNNQSTIKKLFHSSLILIAVIILFFFSGICVKWLVDRGVIRTVYLSYFYGGKNAISQMSVEAILVYSGYLILYLLHYKYLNQRNMESLFFAMCSVIILSARFGQTISIYFPRISFYFIPLQVVSFANITNCYKKSSRKVWIFIILFLYFASWFAITVYKGNGETVPYIFDLNN